MTNPAECEGCADVRENGGSTCGDCGTFLRLLVSPAEALPFKTARDRACGWTSRWERIACPGLDGGPHSQICDSLTVDFQRDRDVIVAAVASTIALNRGQASEVIAAGVQALVDQLVGVRT